MSVARFSKAQLPKWLGKRLWDVRKLTQGVSDRCGMLACGLYTTGGGSDKSGAGCSLTRRGALGVLMSRAHFHPRESGERGEAGWVMEAGIGRGCVGVGCALRHPRKYFPSSTGRLPRR